MGGFVSLTNKATGKTEVVDSDDLPAALASGKYVDPGAVAVHDAGGHDAYATANAARQDAAFSPTIDPTVAAKATGHRIREDANSGVAATARAGLGGVVSGASAGLLSPFEDEQEFHPIASGAGQFVGALAPALVGDEAGLAGLARYTPAGAIGRAGAGLAEGLGGGVLARAAGGAAEGALFGAGQGAGDVARDDDPLTWERAASAIGSNALFGGAIGGGLGLVGGGLERAKRAIDDRLSVSAASAKFADAAPDLATLDRKGLQAARDAEVESIKTAQAPDRKAFVQALEDHRAATEAEQMWLYTTTHADAKVRGLGIESRAADVKQRFLLRNQEALEQSPQRALASLQEQQQALMRVEDRAAADGAKLVNEFRQGPETIRREILDGKLEGYVVGKGGLSPSSPLIDQAVEKEMLKRFGSTDVVNGSPVLPTPMRRVLDTAQNAQVRIGSLRSDIQRLTAEPQSPRLEAIDAARDALSAPHEPSIGERLLHHVPGAGLISEVAGFGGRATTGLRKAAGVAAEKTGAAISSFLGAASKAAPAVTPTATHVLSSVRFGAGPEPKSDELHDLYAARTTELRQQTTVGPDGGIQMKPEARAAITKKLFPIATVNPVLADRIETTIARRTAFMSSKIPKRPEVGGIQVGPDNWRPSDLQIRSWARTVRACEDPGGVEGRLAAGTVTPEDAEAYRACFPARYLALQQQLFAAVPKLPKTLSTAKKVALFTFTGVPTMPALQPNVFKVLQATFAIEPGTKGGTAAPKPMPAFGALGSARSSEQPTPAQKRGG